jgi:hypothetical protein
MKKLVLLLTIPLLFTQAPLWANAQVDLSATTISSDTSWSKDSGPYFLNGNITVASGATLTIEDGTEVRIASGRKIDVYGTLKMQGSVSGVLITAQEDDGVYTFPGQSGRFAGIIFRDGSSGDIQGANIKYAGYEIFGDSTGPAITNLGGEVSVSSSTISKSIYALRTKGGKTVLSGTNLLQNTQGVYAEGGELRMQGGEVRESTYDALMAFGNLGNIQIDGTGFFNNKNNISIELGIPHSVSQITWSGGKYAGVYLSGVTKGNQTLSSSTIYVISNISVSNGDTLTLEPGTVLKGGSIDVYGKLLALGTKQMPAIYTSIADDGAGGDTEANGATDLNASKTGGVLVHTAGSMEAKYMEIRYAGEGQFLGPFNFGYGALTNNGGSIFANHLKVLTQNGSAFHHETGSTTIISSEVLGSYDRSIVFKEGNLYISNTSFAPSYANLSLRNKSVGDVPDLRQNYWGTPEGPYHPIYNATGTASLIEGEALFIPFLGSLDEIVKDPDPVATTTESQNEGGASLSDSPAASAEEASETAPIPGGRRHQVETPAPESQVTFPPIVYEIIPQQSSRPRAASRGEVQGTSTGSLSATAATTSTTTLQTEPSRPSLIDSNSQTAAVSVSWQNDYTELKYLLYFVLGLALLLMLILFTRDKRQIR